MLLGHIGGAARAVRLVARVTAWPKGAYTALKKAAAGTHERTFERTYGYSSNGEVSKKVAKELAHYLDEVGAEPAAAAPRARALRPKRPSR